MVNKNQTLYFLGAETSSPQGSLALWKQSAADKPAVLLGEKIWVKKKSHSEVITYFTDELLKEHCVALKDLSALATGIGPGSFTGVRVALNFIRTLAYSLNLPVITENSLKLLAAPLISTEVPVLCIVNAYKNLIYTALYTKSKEGLIEELIPPQALPAHELERRVPNKCVVVGDGWELFQPQFSQKFHNQIKQVYSDKLYPQAQSFLDLGPTTQTMNSPKDWNSVAPLYIRESEAEEKLKIGLLKPIPEI